MADSRLAAGGARLLRTRWFVRAPIWLYRLRLGFLFGSRMLMLEHIGRASGIRRFVVLEVVDRPAPGTYVVVSGFGERAQWLRNVRAEPHVRVHVGGRRSVAATARVLGPAEASESLERFIGSHPRAWAKARPVLEKTLGTRIEVGHTELPMVAVELER